MVLYIVSTDIAKVSALGKQGIREMLRKMAWNKTTYDTTDFDRKFTSCNFQGKHRKALKKIFYVVETISV